MKLKPGLHNYNFKINDYDIHFKCDFKLDSVELILFIHGLACSGDSFRNLFDADYFSESSLLVPDLIGFGESSKSDEFSYTMEDQAILVEKLLEAFPFKKLHVVAHSMGNAIALLLSREVMSKVLSVANLEGNLISEDCGLLSQGIIENPFQEYQKKGFKIHQNDFADHPQLRFNQATALAVYKSAQSLVQLSESGELLFRYKNLVCKKCYFWGEENADMPVLKKLKGMRTIMIPNSGHGMMTDNPKFFYTALADFIR